MIKFFYDEKMDEFRWGHIIVSVVALIVAIILAFSMIKTVPTGYTGILTTFGKVEPNTVSAGVHVIAPWQKIVKLDNRTQQE